MKMEVFKNPLNLEEAISESKKLPKKRVKPLALAMGI